MWTNESILDTLAKIDFKAKNTKAEVKVLHTLLQPEEKLINVVEGVLKNINKLKINGLGLIILTNSRIIFFRKSMIGTVTQEDYSLHKISSISNRKGIITHSITVYGANNEATIEQIYDGMAARSFVADAKDLLAKQSNVNPIAPLTQPVASKSDELKSLFELKQMGALTEEEYESQKKKILSQ